MSVFRGINTGLHAVNTGLHVASFAQRQDDRQENKQNKAQNQQFQQQKKAFTSKLNEELHFHQNCVRTLSQMKSEMVRKGNLEMKANKLRQRDLQREKKALEAQAKAAKNMQLAAQYANEANESLAILHSHEERHQLALDNCVFEFENAIAHHQSLIEALRQQQAQMNNGEFPAVIVDRTYVAPTPHVVLPLFESSATPPTYNETVATMSNLQVSQSSPTPTGNPAASVPSLPQAPYPGHQGSPQQAPYPPQQYSPFPGQMDPYPPQQPSYPPQQSPYPPQQQSPYPPQQFSPYPGQSPVPQQTQPQSQPPKPARTRSANNSSPTQDDASADPTSSTVMLQKALASGEPMAVRSLYSFAFISAQTNGTVVPNGAGLDGSTLFYFMKKDPNANAILLRCGFNERKYLRVQSGNVDCDGSGGPFCEFNIIHNDDGTVSFRSVKDPEYLLAVDSSLKVIGTKADHHHYSRKFVLGR